MRATQQPCWAGFKVEWGQGTAYHLLPLLTFPMYLQATTYLPKDSSLILLCCSHSLLLHPASLPPPFLPLSTAPSTSSLRKGKQLTRELFLNLFLLMAALRRKIKLNLNSP